MIIVMIMINNLYSAGAIKYSKALNINLQLKKFTGLNLKTVDNFRKITVVLKEKSNLTLLLK